jgi:hypothetical protein
MNKMFTLPTIQPKNCGNCDVCCWVLGVVELGKPYYVTCQHQREGQTGCVVYGSHPNSCKSYFCGWMTGLIAEADEKYRPDRFGVLMTVEKDIDTRGQLSKWLTVYESRENGVGTIQEDHCLSLNGDMLDVILKILKTNLDLIGVRFIFYNQRVATSYSINRANYPDEGESNKLRLFSVYSDKPKILALLESPQRGSKDPLPDNIRNNLVAHREKSPKEKAYERRRRHKK